MYWYQKTDLCVTYVDDDIEKLNELYFNECSMKVEIVEKTRNSRVRLVVNEGIPGYNVSSVCDVQQFILALQLKEQRARSRSRSIRALNHHILRLCGDKLDSDKRGAKAMPEVRVDGTITNEELRIRLTKGGINCDKESEVIEVLSRRRNFLSDNGGEEDDMNYYYYAGDEKTHYCRTLLLDYMDLI